MKINTYIFFFFSALLSITTPAHACVVGHGTDGNQVEYCVDSPSESYLVGEDGGDEMGMYMDIHTGEYTFTDDEGNAMGGCGGFLGGSSGQDFEL